MRSMLAGAVATALMAASGAAADSGQAGANYPAPGMHMPRPGGPQGAPMGQRMGGSRWGGKVGGRWSGGVNAPGGWAAYRAPYRGYRLPSYWATPRFYVTDWSRYGFAAPAPGRFWTRYYDDAVLIDGGGEVYDVVGGVDWDRYDGGYAYEGARSGGSSGLAGAAVGAAIGGVAGNVIAGRGNRLAGTLVGAGVGAAAGYAAERAGGARRGPPPPYGADYGRPPMAGDYPPPPPPGDYGRYHGRVERRVYREHDGYAGPGGSRWVSPDGSTTVVTTTGGVYAPPPPPPLPYPAYGYGYGYGAGYAYGAGSVTTVTVQSAPVVTTTTTTEIIEDRAVYRRPVAVRRVYKARRVWRPRPRPRATCVCGS